MLRSTYRFMGKGLTLIGVAATVMVATTASAQAPLVV